MSQGQQVGEGSMMVVVSFHDVDITACTGADRLETSQLEIYIFQFLATLSKTLPQN